MPTTPYFSSQTFYLINGYYDKIDSEVLICKDLSKQNAVIVGAILYIKKPVAMTLGNQTRVRGCWDVGFLGNRNRVLRVLPSTQNTRSDN